MQFMVIERFRAGAKPIYERFGERGRQMPDGLAFVASWVTADPVARPKIPIRLLRRIRGASIHPRCSRGRATQRYRVRLEASTAAPHQAHRSFSDEPHARVFQLMECDDVTLLQRWVGAWEDLADVEIVPVVSGGSPVADAVLGR
jgi:hypothetical protein